MQEHGAAGSIFLFSPKFDFGESRVLRVVYL